VESLNQPAHNTIEHAGLNDSNGNNDSSNSNGSNASKDVDSVRVPQRVKVRRKKIPGDNPIKKFVVRRKNSEFLAGNFLTTTTTTQSPLVDLDAGALNRTQDDSRCERR
jgi:hypothetical protein